MANGCYIDRYLIVPSIEFRSFLNIVNQWLNHGLHRSLLRCAWVSLNNVCWLAQM